MEAFHPSRCGGLASTSSAQEEFHRPFEENEHQCHGDLDQLEQKRRKEEDFKKLHSAIESGDLKTVRSIVENHRGEKLFSVKNTSALFKALNSTSKNHEIIAYLIRTGAKTRESESNENGLPEIDVQLVNYYLDRDCRTSKDSCVHKLLVRSLSPQGVESERRFSLMTMYKEFFEYEIINTLMNVLAINDFEIVFDFEEDDVSRMRLDRQNSDKIFGITDLISKEIKIGAKHLLSDDREKIRVVYGVSAEELCHLAMTFVFENEGKPYSFEEDSEFSHIFSGVNTLVYRSYPVEEVIENVFGYPVNQMEAELIARVPHIIGIYGEVEGKKKFEKYPELRELLNYYEKKVNPKCKEYFQERYSPRHKKYHRIIKQIRVKNCYVSFKEKINRPLKQDPFEKYELGEENFSVINTEFTKLCMLHVYHLLKDKFGAGLETKCLFYKFESVRGKKRKMLEILIGEVYKYLILILDEGRSNELEDFNTTDLLEFTNKGTKLILIKYLKQDDSNAEGKTLNYEWEDLTDKYKESLTWPVKYIFRKQFLEQKIDESDVKVHFRREDIVRLMKGDRIKVKDGKDLYSKGYNSKTYIKREFQAMVVDRAFLENLPSGVIIFLSGFDKKDEKELPFDTNLVQWLKKSLDETENGKSVFVIDKATPNSFGEFKRTNGVDACIWLHYYESVFYVRNSDSSGDIFRKNMEPKTLSEDQILNILDQKSIILISDNAGYGKTTVISSIINQIKKKHPTSWNRRVDFGKFGEKLSQLKEECDQEDVRDYLHQILGFKNGFERYLFGEFNTRRNSYIYFDGFDEISPEYMEGAKKLLSYVRNRTYAKIIISTRKYHQLELEECLNTYSHQLVPLSRKDQVSYLERMWKDKLNCLSGNKKVEAKIKRIIEKLKESRSKFGTEFEALILGLEDLSSNSLSVNDLNFSKVAECVTANTSLEKDLLEFMGIPLHLFMVGNIYYDSNFNMENESDVYSIYSKFIEEKIRIYLEEKQGMDIYKTSTRKYTEKTTENAYEVHIELATQLMNKGKVDSRMSEEEDWELCNSLGIVFIKDAEVDFLHHTFAEFFKAESIRKSVDRDIFRQMLFDDQYKVVRRFLKSAFEKEKFENLKKEFSNDVNFLFATLKTLAGKSTLRDENFYDHELNFDVSCVSKIVKELLGTFESFRSNLLDDFLKTFDSEIAMKPLANWYCVGGCVPVEMFKMLLDRNFMIYQNMILGMVRYSVSPEDVIDVLNEYISIEKHQRCPSENEAGGNVEEDSASLLRLFAIKDENGKGLLHYGLWNERPEIFTNILRFAWKGLGKQQFIESIVKDNVYRKPMDEFITKFQWNRIAGLLKASVAKEVDVFFDDNLKFRMVRRAFGIRNEPDDSFEEAMNLFKGCFGIQNFEDVLLHRDSDGDCLIHCLVAEGRDVIKNLDYIRKEFKEESKIEQFFKSEDRESKNVLHLGASNGKLGDYLRYCVHILKEDDVKKMLRSFDKNGENPFHILLRSASSVTLEKDIQDLKLAVADDEWFKTLLQSEDKYSRNIFHLAASNRSIRFNDVLQICNRYLEPDIMMKMFHRADGKSQYVMEILFDYVVLTIF